MAAGAATTGWASTCWVGAGVTWAPPRCSAFLVGGGLQTARNYGGRLLGKLQGQRELTLNDNLLRLLALRQRQLLGALNARGPQRRPAPIQLDTPATTAGAIGKLPEALRRAAPTRTGPAQSRRAPGAGGAAPTGRRAGQRATTLAR